MRKFLAGIKPVAQGRERRKEARKFHAGFRRARVQDPKEEEERSGKRDSVVSSVIGHVIQDLKSKR